MQTVDEVIHLLDLKPHPEGGYYREAFRDRTASPMERAASTAIYFLLRRGECSRWHRVDAAEAWHWYAGAALHLQVVENPSGNVATISLGVNFERGERPQSVVAPGWWQRARSLGDWTLVGCTVAPGFEFAHFEIAKDEAMPTDWA